MLMPYLEETKQINDPLPPSTPSSLLSWHGTRVSSIIMLRYLVEWSQSKARAVYVCYNLFWLRTVMNGSSSRTVTSKRGSSWTGLSLTSSTLTLTQRCTPLSPVNVRILFPRNDNVCSEGSRGKSDKCSMSL